MCVRTIIDANMFGELLSDKIKPLRNWIERKDGILVYPDGGKYHEELKRLGFSIHDIEQPKGPHNEQHDHEPKQSKKIQRLLRTYRQRGFVTRIRRSCIEEGDKYVDTRCFRSNDSHIMALAHASSALVLCTNDKSLKEDFTNPDLLPRVGSKRRAVYPLHARPGDQRSFVDHRKCALRQKA